MIAFARVCMRIMQSNQRHYTSQTHQPSPSPVSSNMQVFEWLTFALTELTPLLDDKLVVMNDWLLTRTFLAGSQPTLADLVLYAFVSPAAVGGP
jgi:glutathione S-transferase